MSLVESSEECAKCLQAVEINLLAPFFFLSLIKFYRGSWAYEVLPLKHFLGDTHDTSILTCGEREL